MFSRDQLKRAASLTEEDSSAGVFYRRRGRINARELWEQMNACSCLNLILACIIYWQACEITRVLSECDPVANGIDLSLLEHVSPIEWDNVVLYLDRDVFYGRRG